MSGEEQTSELGWVHEPLFFVNKTTGEPCPTDGLALCTVADWRTHRHVDGRNRPGSSPNGDAS